MNKQDRLNHQQQEYQKQWETLSNRIAAIQHQKSITLDAEQQFIYEKRLQSLKQERNILGKEWEDFEQACFTQVQTRQTHLSPHNLENYLNTLCNHHIDIELGSFQKKQEREVSIVKLDQVYIPLRLNGQNLTETDSKDIDSSPPKQADTIFSTQLLAPKTITKYGCYLVILGDAGCGKTTILQHLIVSLARAYLNKDGILLQKQTGYAQLSTVPWPLFISWRYYHYFCHSQGHAITLGSFIDFLPHHFAQEYDCQLPTDFFRHLLKSGQCVLTLDGFDEVPLNDRPKITKIIRALVKYPPKKQNIILLTSRVAAYGGENQLGGQFNPLWVHPLNAKEREAQIKQWVFNVKAVSKHPLKANDILRVIKPKSALAKLAITPMVVTTLCIIYFYGRKLPEQRAELYERCVEIILTEGSKSDEGGQKLATQIAPPQVKRKRLARLAFELHYHSLEQAKHKIIREWLRPEFKQIGDDLEREVAIDIFLSSIVDRGTLLQEWNGSFGFGQHHLTFKEFLAGYHIVYGLRAKERQNLWLKLITNDWWREPIRLGVSLAVTEGMGHGEDVLAELLDLTKATYSPATRLAAYKLAAESLWDAGQAAKKQMIDPELQSLIINGLATCLFEKDVIDPDANLLSTRIAATEALAHLGDPRPGIITLNDVQFCYIPAGPFWMGSKKETDQMTVDVEKPYHQLTLAYNYWLARYPLTVAQFESFITETDYKLQDEDSVQGIPNHPVRWITWHEALDFCHWLTKKWHQLDYLAQDWHVTLPSEAEWEKAAKGGIEIPNKPVIKTIKHLKKLNQANTLLKIPKKTNPNPHRIYPWGNKFQATHANWWEVGIGTTSSVGLFPTGQSPYGCLDMSGNVWEWTRSVWGINYPYNPTDGRETLKSDNDRVLRGGSFYYLKPIYLRCAYRRGYPPTDRNSYLGMRLMIGPKITNKN